MKTIVQTLAMATAILLAPTVSEAQSSATSAAISDKERASLFPSRDLIEFGRVAAEANCASCHGMDGKSDAEGEPNLAGQRTVGRNELDCRFALRGNNRRQVGWQLRRLFMTAHAQLGHSRVVLSSRGARRLSSFGSKQILKRNLTAGHQGNFMECSRRRMQLSDDLQRGFDV